MAIAEALRLRVRFGAIVHGNRDDLDDLVSVTIGAAATETSGPKSAADLIASAGRTLYVAKHAGRKKVFAA